LRHERFLSLIWQEAVVAMGAANTLAHIGVLEFIAIWASLLIGGQWFWYRIGLAAAQQAHFFLTIWGIATLTYLSAGP
jgi:hypothetical protein